MTTPSTISVTGTSLLPQKAELALLDVEISTTGFSRSFVSSEVQLSCRRLEDLLRKSSTPASLLTTSSSNNASPAIEKPIVKHWTMNNIHTSTHLPTDANGVVLKSTQTSYTTTISFVIHITEFGALGTFASNVVLLPYTSINGVRWRLHDSTRKAHDGRLRSRAVKDALERAKDYAKALGLSAVWPVEVKEVQWCDDDGDAKRKGPGRVGVADLFLEPEEVMLSARVECKFEAE
ncbi:hypothetical protein E4T44_11582 [Aureobasidium sp. EXF-8845]|nr:hypothetical protein E4T45_11341 [Aureobasidium sp. EXF-8846]KAI4801384.1 hypothetical protein E4T44_11582 [Aureobasidium sp. EXF-8845]